MWALLMAAMAITEGQPCTATCVAWGSAPEWRIEAERDRWSLHVDDGRDLRLVPGAWQDTPRGRRLTGTIGGARFVLLATFGSCGRAPGDRRGGSSHFAHLTLPDGRVLRGCMADGAIGGYPG